MATVAEVLLWGRRIGAVALEDGTDVRRGGEAEESIDGEPCGAIKPAQLRSQALVGPRNGRSRVKIDDVSCGTRASKFKALSYRRHAATCSC